MAQITEDFSDQTNGPKVFLEILGQKIKMAKITGDFFDQTNGTKVEQGREKRGLIEIPTAPDPIGEKNSPENIGETAEEVAVLGHSRDMIH